MPPKPAAHSSCGSLRSGGAGFAVKTKEWLAMILAVLTAAGCGRKADHSAAAPETAANGQPPAIAVTNANQPAGGVSDADLAAALGELTQTLRKFSAEKQRVPKSLSELVSAGYLSRLPDPPPGKVFTINEKRVEVILTSK